MAKPKDPTEAIRLKASQYPEVDEGTACTQSSFKTGKKSFLYIGMQGGRYKAMFKLDKSIEQAKKLAAKDSDCYEVGNTSWVTARFTAEKPIPKKVWEKWLDESYEISRGGKATKKVAKKAVKKKAAKKKAVKKKAAKKKAVKKKTTTKTKKKKAQSKAR